MLARLTNAKILISKTCPRSEKACKKLLGRKKNQLQAIGPGHTLTDIVLFSAVLMSTDFEDREEKQQVWFTESWF